MKDKRFVLNTVLAAVLGIGLIAAVLVRAFVPWIILPRPEIPNVVLICLAALLVDHYIARGAGRCYVCVPVLSALSFGLLPLAAGFLTTLGAVKLALLGGGVFTVTTWLYTSIQERLSSGPVAKAAPVLSALGLYLASQCLMGIGI